MSVFANDDIHKLLALWKGNVKIYKKDGHIIKIDLSKRYEFDFFNDKEPSENHNREMLNVVKSVINGYNFLKIEGDRSGIMVTATVKPESIEDFQFYCSHLKRIEKIERAFTHSKIPQSE